MLDRRDFLTTVVSVTVVVTAGCTSSDTEEDQQENSDAAEEDEQENSDAAEEDQRKDPEKVVEEYLKAEISGDVETQEKLLHERATHRPSEDAAEDITFDQFVNDVTEISVQEHLQSEEFDEFTEEEIDDAIQEFEQTTEDRLNEIGAEDYTLVRWEGTEPSDSEDGGLYFTEIELLVYDDGWLIYDRVSF